MRLRIVFALLGLVLCLGIGVLILGKIFHGVPTNPISPGHTATSTPPVTVKNPNPNAQIYFSDTFESAPHTNYYWGLYGCSSSSHADGSRYPTLGQAIRSGYCGPYSESGNTLFRFIVQPFDVRFKPLDVSKGVGGSEMGERSDQDVYSSANKSGWDFYGTSYNNSQNTVRYEWDFRLNDLSMLQQDLVNNIVVGQFHSINDARCGGAPTNSSPSPGLQVDLRNNNQDVRFSVYIKPIYRLIPDSLKRYADATCTLAPDSPCTITVWRGFYPLKDVLANWMHVAFTIKFSQTDGTLAVEFGEKGKAGDLAYQTRTFLSGTQTLNVPTTVNTCPYTAHLGVYALGYNSLYYGTLDTTSATSRMKNGQSWVTPAFKETYGRFIDGTEATAEVPPQIVLDYDNFVISEAYAQVRN